ncbi:alcohol oxidase [Mycena galericulata]|nr:alcohol oxidase [Mycena galericulata]
MSTPQNLDIFDYVVIGGGTAGLVVASRLVEDPLIRVCVLEAGSDVSEELDIKVPGFGYKNYEKPDMNWGFGTEAQRHAAGRVIPLPRGKALGGSSMVSDRNIFLRLSLVFETLGSPGWNWEGLVEYFRKSETFTATTEEMKSLGVELNPATHGTTGPIQRTLPKWISRLREPMIQSMRALGVEENSDSFSGNNAGTWTVHCSIDSQATRSSSASGYYSRVKSHPNLVVITTARATRILFGPANRSGAVVATGVEYSKDGKMHTVSAHKEVLLCAGTFQTPQLLELSGIGDKEILKEHGIPLEVDLPGDHFWCPYVAEADSTYESVEVLANPVRAVAELKLYEESKLGMFTGMHSPCFAFLSKQYFADGWDHERALKSVPASQQKQIQADWLNADMIPFLEMAIFPGFLPVPGHAPEAEKTYCSFLIALTHAFARGTVHIAARDPFAAPKIDQAMLDNEVDVNILVQGIKLARRLAAGDSLRDVITHEVLPGMDVQSDDALIEYVRRTVTTVFHPIGTAAMLPRNSGGVVDASLRVYGTANLRVIDASVIPIHLSAHIQATVYAVAEKVASLFSRPFCV